MKIVKYLIAAVLVVSITKKVHVEDNQKSIEFTVALAKNDIPKVSGIYDAINKRAFIGFTDVVEYNRAVTPPNISNPKLIRFGIYPTPGYDSTVQTYGGLTKETSLWGIPQTSTTQPTLKNPELTALQIANQMMPSLTASTDIELTPEIQTISNLTLPDIKVSGSFVMVKSVTKPYKIIGKYYATPHQMVILNDGTTYVGITQHKDTHYKGIGPVWTWMSQEEINKIINDLAQTYGMLITKDTFKTNIKEIGLVRQNKTKHILYGFLLSKK